jgi:hypothetical protein
VRRLLLDAHVRVVLDGQVVRLDGPGVDFMDQRPIFKIFSPEKIITERKLVLLN